MNKFTYLDFDTTVAFARSDKGAEYIDEQHAGETANQEHGGTFSVYRTPEAAALAALAEGLDDEPDWPGDAFSVTVVRSNGILLYGADTTHYDGMTHTDRHGFVDFLKGNDWLDSDWVVDVYDIDLDAAECKPSNLMFNPDEAWTLHEARAIAANSDEALLSPSVYYHNAQPRVFELDGGDAMLIIFNHGVPVRYGVLDAASLQALREDVRNVQLADIDYSLRLYRGLEHCYYTSDRAE